MFYVEDCMSRVVKNNSPAEIIIIISISIIKCNQNLTADCSDKCKPNAP